jgi:hypothetical protein
MIKSEELMIGNIIQTTANILCVVDVLGNDNIQSKRFGDSCPMLVRPEDYRGLPLTEEWLLSFGFESVKDYPGHYRLIKEPKFCIYLNENNYFTLGCWDNDVRFTSVHHLQNAYFGHTGRQLEIIDK